MTEQENYANLTIGLLNGTLELIDVGKCEGHSTTIRLAMVAAQQDLARARRGLTNALSHELMTTRERPNPTQTTRLSARTLSSDRAEDR